MTTTTALTVRCQNCGRLNRVPATGEGRRVVPGGTETTLRLEDGTVVTLRVVAFPEEAPEGAEDTVLTLHSPLARALVGHGPGDTVTYATPEGQAHATVLDLRPPAGDESTRPRGPGTGAASTPQVHAPNSSEPSR